MKAKLLLVVSVAVVVLITGATIMFFVRQETLGNMSDKILKNETSSSNFSFIGSAGDRLKISLRTTVDSGTVDFILSDSKGNLVQELDRARALETYVYLSYDDTYTLAAVYKDFIGKFSAKVRKNRF